MTKILELYGVSTRSITSVNWETVVSKENCPYLQRKCLKVRKSRPEDTIGTCTTGMNWKMTAKTILVQLHHKVQTFQEINKHLVLVIQNHFMNYIRQEFRFEHLNPALIGDSAHFHVYNLKQDNENGSFRLGLDTRFSTDANGIAECLGLQTNQRMELEQIVKLLGTRISERTLFTLY